MRGPYTAATRWRRAGEPAADGSTTAMSNSPGRSWCSQRATAVAAARWPPPVSAMRKRSGRATGGAYLRGRVDRHRLELAEREPRQRHGRGAVDVGGVRLEDAAGIVGKEDEPAAARNQPHGREVGGRRERHRRAVATDEVDAQQHGHAAGVGDTDEGCGALEPD